MTIGGYLAVRFERLLEGWLINESADSRRPIPDTRGPKAERRKAAIVDVQRIHLCGSFRDAYPSLRPYARLRMARPPDLRRLGMGN